MCFIVLILTFNIFCPPLCVYAFILEHLCGRTVKSSQMHIGELEVTSDVNAHCLVFHFFIQRVCQSSTGYRIVTV